MTAPAYLDYCYGDEVKIDSFCRLPRILVTDGFYRTVPAEIKILYCLMLDRVAMSMRNDWRDEYGRVVIFFTIREAARLLNVGKDKATRLFKRMETLGLIRRRKQGPKLPDLILVRTFVEVPVEDMEEASEETATDFAEADSVPGETPEAPAQSEYVEQPPVCEEAATPTQIEAPEADTDSGLKESDTVRNGLSDLLCECAASVRRLGDLLLGAAPESQTSPEQTSRRPLWGSLDCPKCGRSYTDIKIKLNCWITINPSIRKAQLYTKRTAPNKRRRQRKKKIWKACAEPRTITGDKEGKWEEKSNYTQAWRNRFPARLRTISTTGRSF